MARTERIREVAVAAAIEALRAGDSLLDAAAAADRSVAVAKGPGEDQPG